MTLFDLMPSFKRYALYEKGITAKSFRQIKNTVFRLSKHTGVYELPQLKTGVIRAFLYDQKEKFDWTAKTFRNNRQYLNSFFHWCQLVGHINENPIFSIDKPKIAKTLPRFLTRSQINTIVSVVNTYPWTNTLQMLRNKAIVMTFIYTGVRLQELLSLQVDHLDFESNQLLIFKGKGQKDRVIPIHSSLCPFLEIYLGERQRMLPASKWLFTGLHSSYRMHPKDIYRFFNQVSFQSKIKFTPHQLRHSFGRLAVENNFNIFKLKEIMGHANISTTQIYLSASTKSVQDSFDKIELI